MNKSITFVTGNQEKIRDAQHVAKEYDIDVNFRSVDIDEIQHHDPLKITEHKAKEAYKLVGNPVIVNDSSWAIPSLGGFPGGYIKDVASWLSTEDFLTLMKDKSDKSIFLTDINGYYDGQTYKEFSTTRRGKFIPSPRGRSEPSFARLVVMDGDDRTISEIFDLPSRTIDSSRYEQWHKFMEWFSSQ